MFNDISPDGYSSPLLPMTPATQVEKNIRDNDATLRQFPVLKEVIKRLEASIAKSDSIKYAMLTADKYEIDREVALIALDIVRLTLEGEKRYIEARVNRTK